MYLLTHRSVSYTFFFFFNDTATTEIYTLSLHDALPILVSAISAMIRAICAASARVALGHTSHNPPVVGSSPTRPDRKSTRLNSSHSQISYAVFCLKKKTHLSATTPSSVPRPTHSTIATD